MFSLSKRARLGIYVMVELARAPDRLRANDELARFLGVSVSHLAKVAQRLARAGWLQGTRGPSGGYKLAVDVRHLSLADIIEVFEGAPGFDACTLADDVACNRERDCRIKGVMREIEEHAYYTLQSVTVRSLAEAPVTAPLVRIARKNAAGLPAAT